MAHFAKVVDSRVVQVIVAEPSFFETYTDPYPGEWLQTSYNTRGGIHMLGGTPFRKNFAGVGYTYDALRDAFIPPKLFASWILNEQTCLWDPPIPYPEDNKTYMWVEPLGWMEV